MRCHLLVCLTLLAACRRGGDDAAPATPAAAAPAAAGDLQQLRAYQDFNQRNALASVPGVAEVASVGGYQKQYQIVVDPARLASFESR